MSQRSIKVLLIEDDEEDYIITKDLLSDITETRYHLDWAPSFDDGIKAIVENNYDVYLVDYRLGRKEGLEIINHISSEKKKSPFILLTGQSDSTLDQIAMEAGAADFLDKSILSASLLDRAIRYSIKQNQVLLALTKEKEKLNEAQRLSSIGNYELIISTNTLSCSDEFFRIFGLEPNSDKDILNKFEKRIHPDDLEEVQKQINETIEKKKRTQFKYRIICPDRGVRYLKGIREVELDNADNVIRLFGSIQDLTDQVKQKHLLKKEQENAKMFLDMAGNIILVVDHDEKISLINREGVQLLGYSEEQELIGKNWFDIFIPEEVRSEVRSVFYNLIHHKLKNVEHYENKIIDKKGNKHLIKWYNRLLFNEAGEPTGTISSGIDITAQRKAEAKLSQYATDLENRVAERTSELAQNETKLKIALEKEKELGELKSRFVAMASHEFRTPLSSILSSAELIGQYPKEEQQSKRDRHIKRISSSVQNLTGILNDFLSLEKLESDKIRYNPQTIDLNIFLPELLEEISLTTKSDQTIELRINGATEIETDPHLLKNILINLLSNAIKYSPNKENVQLLIDRNKDQTIIQVIDHGIGIPEADQKHMFSRFFRATNANTIKGTGLGLTIVRRYLDLMGGSISFESKEGKGTTFMVQLP